MKLEFFYRKTGVSDENSMSAISPLVKAGPEVPVLQIPGLRHDKTSSFPKAIIIIISRWSAFSFPTRLVWAAGTTGSGKYTGSSHFKHMNYKYLR